MRLSLRAGWEWWRTSRNRIHTKSKALQPIEVVQVNGIGQFLEQSWGRQGIVQGSPFYHCVEGTLLNQNPLSVNYYFSAEIWGNWSLGLNYCIGLLYIPRRIALLCTSKSVKLVLVLGTCNYIFRRTDEIRASNLLYVSHLQTTTRVICENSSEVCCNGLRLNDIFNRSHLSFRISIVALICNDWLDEGAKQTLKLRARYIFIAR